MKSAEEYARELRVLIHDETCRMDDIINALNAYADGTRPSPKGRQMSELIGSGISERAAAMQRIQQLEKQLEIAREALKYVVFCNETTTRKNHCAMCEVRAKHDLAKMEAVR